MNSHLRWQLVFVLALASPAFSALQSAGAPARATDDAFQGARDHLASQVQSGAYQGAVALVQVGSERVLQVIVGDRDSASDTEMELDTIFRIYSMTKPVTAVAALILCDEGKLDLDDPVADYLHEFEGIEVGVEKGGKLTRVAAERPMTVRDLCRHTAGLTYGIFARSMVDALVVQAGVFDPRISNKELAGKLSTIPLKTQPGSNFEYSLASDLLGRVIEVAADQPLGEFMQARIFKPLGMVDTGFNVEKSKLQRVATCYRRTGGKLSPTRPGEALDPAFNSQLESGGGGLFSTAEDYMLFCRMLLGAGALGDVRILKEESAAEMMSDQLNGIPAPMLRGSGGAFGLGIAVSTPVRAKGPHSGTVWWGGYAGTGFWVDREADMVGVFMIQNINEVAHSNAFRSRAYKAVGR